MIAPMSRSKRPERAEGAAPAGQVELGPRLRMIRERKGLSLADVARDTGISKSFLSLVETGSSDISFGRLHRLINYYAIHINDVMAAAPAEHDGLIRSGFEPHLRSPGEGIDVYLLAPDTEHRMLPLLSIFRPLAETTDREGHDGDEFIHVLEGTIEVHFTESDSVLLARGDSLYYAGRAVTGLRNPGNREARLFAVVSPPIF